MTIAAGAVLGRYQLVSLLGAGGMAEVWKAKIVGPAGFERTVVVKRVLSHLGRDAAFVQMFLAEAKLSAQLAHPNIVQVYELGQELGEYFMAMEYVKGCDLGWIIRRRLDLPVGFAVMVTQAICRALDYAHSLRDGHGAPLRLVHRDVSPANIMLGHDGTVKLLDFGIAKALGAAADHRTETGTLKGKLGYMSPEQVDGQTIDHRADLFAVGVVLHELLTHQRLFKGASDFLTLTMMRSAAAPPPSSINPAVPPALDAICLQALARDPDRRFSSGAEMAEALEPFLDGWSPERLRRVMDAVSSEQEAAAARVGPTLTGEAAPAAGDAIPTPVETIPEVSRPRAPRGGTRWWMVASAAAITLGIAGVAMYRPDNNASSSPEAASSPAPSPSAPPQTREPSARPLKAASAPAPVAIPEPAAPTPEPAPPTTEAPAPRFAQPTGRPTPTAKHAPSTGSRKRKPSRPSTEASSAAPATKPTTKPTSSADFDPESALP